MQKKRSTKELIRISVLELLENRTVAKITVKDIAENCGITPRTFYHYYSDKNAAINAIYIEHMTKFMDSSLTEWVEQKTKLFMSAVAFFRHALLDEGQNNLLETIIEMDYQKYMRHIQTEKMTPIELKIIQNGIYYMLYGNVGLMKVSMKGNMNITPEEFSKGYHNTWDLMQEWVPQRVKSVLNEIPVSRRD